MCTIDHSTTMARGIRKAPGVVLRVFSFLCSYAHVHAIHPPLVLLESKGSSAPPPPSCSLNKKMREEIYHEAQHV